MSKTNGEPLERSLTARQMECLRLYWDRKSTKEIGRDLGITRHAVEKHLLACRERLSVHTSIEAARLVFGDDQAPTVRPYYEASEVLAGGPALHLSTTSTAHDELWGVGSERAPINRFGAVATLGIILAVAVISICAVAVLIEVGQGINQLGRAMGY